MAWAKVNLCEPFLRRLQSHSSCIPRAPESSSGPWVTKSRDWRPTRRLWASPASQRATRCLRMTHQLRGLLPRHGGSCWAASSRVGALGSRRTLLILGLVILIAACFYMRVYKSCEGSYHDPEDETLFLYSGYQDSAQRCLPARGLAPHPVAPSAGRLACSWP